MKKNTKNSLKNVTVAQYADIKGIDKVAANSVLRFLVHIGAAEITGKVETGKKGKPASIFGLPNEITFKAFAKVAAKVKSIKKDDAEPTEPPATPATPAESTPSGEAPAQTDTDTNNPNAVAKAAIEALSEIPENDPNDDHLDDDLCAGATDPDAIAKTAETAEQNENTNA